jgi:ssDNA-binding Zn-finger/Zn-ribbon topoisomerase 1
MSVLHCFPQLSLSQRFSQSKLDALINTSTNDYINQQKMGYNSRTKKVSSSKPDNMTLKQFKGGNNLWIESLGNDGDRVRGMSCDAIFYDECFPGGQYIEVSGSRGKKTIGEIYRDFVKGKELPLIKTYNEETDKFEYKRVLNAWKRDESSLLQITCGNREVRCTTNHRFLTDSGWKRADELIQGSLIRISPGTKTYIRALNDDQEQIMLGSFLGDGSLTSNDNILGDGRYRVRVIHGIQQREYCEWKAGIFGENVTVIANNGYAQTPAVRFCTKTIAIANKLPKTKTTCPQWVLDKLDIRGLAIWFMDDGTVQHNKYGALYTSSFDDDSQARFMRKLKTYGIESSCHYDCYTNEDTGEEGSYPFLTFGRDAYEKLSKLIAPYVHSNIEYKIVPEHRKCEKYIWNDIYPSYGYTIVDQITYLDKKEIVYDIEVEDNHNFIVSPGNTTKSAGGLIAHNCQDMSPTAIGVAQKTLVAAKYGPPGAGIQVYFGTPKAKGSYFEVGLWNQSDKRYYFLGCTNKDCAHYFMLSTPGTEEWKKIWLFGQTIKCPKCGNEEDKRVLVENGKWMPTEERNKDGTEKKFVGYHISQLYVPYLDKNYILNQHPENNKASSERIYYNEALGEFYSGNDMPITRDEIYEKCRDSERMFSRTINPNDRKTWMGVDWGGKVDGENGSTGQSYSCVVVISADSSGTLSVEFAYRMKSGDFQHKMEFIKSMYKNYGLNLAVADWGYGHDICTELQKIYGNKFLSAATFQNMNKNTTYEKDILQLKWNKDYYIEEMYDLMRKGKIRFPWKSFENVDWLVEHIASMEIVHSEKNGMPKKMYQKGTLPNDGFMALIYAYLAYKFDVSRGFTINANNPTQSALPIPRLAYVPKLR